MCKEYGFNSRTRKGCDEQIKAFTDYCIKVSIHAPARGATVGKAFILEPWQVSIHAPARGATLTLSKLEKLLGVSIHAPARGATDE